MKRDSHESLFCLLVKPAESSFMVLQKIELGGLGNGLRAAVDIQLPIDIARVDFHRSHRQYQSLGNITVRQPISNQMQHSILHLAIVAPSLWLLLQMRHFFLTS